MELYDYSKYSTENPYEDRIIFEGKGIPNILKFFSNKINNSIDLSKNKLLFNLDETDFKLKDLKLEIINQDRADIYAYSRFGSINNDILENAEIVISFNFNHYSKDELKRVILHELLHVYEIYHRIKNKVGKKIQWDLNNELMKIRNNYLNDNFISDFIYLIYASLDQEIGARVAETYSILIEERSKDKSYLLTIIKKTKAWNMMLYLKSFKKDNYVIDYNNCFNFFNELNTIMSNKGIIKKFNIFKIPKDKKDINLIINSYIKLFKDKSIKYEGKLLKIIDEVIADMNKMYP